MATERDVRPAHGDPSRTVALPDDAPTAVPSAYEAPTILFLGTLRDLTAVGSFPDPT